MNFAIVPSVSTIYAVGNHFERLSWMSHAPDQGLKLCLTMKDRSEGLK